MDILIMTVLSVGLALIVMSFFIKDFSKPKTEDMDRLIKEVQNRVLDEKNLEELREGLMKLFNDKLSKLSDDKLEETEYKMSEVANNKMIAISDLGTQLLEKVDQNHKEVIFLYDMLNEKNENIRDLSAKIDGLRKELEKEELRIRELAENIIEKIEERPTETEEIILEDLPKIEETIEEDPLPLSKNEQIIKMKKDGMTITEISRELNMGQGEVSLILGLYDSK